jgi:predicted cupin superfamily sugar epimerase
VAPGFDFTDFEMPDRGTLLGLFPEHQEIILEFTNP